MQLLGEVRPFCDLPRQGKGCGVKQPPCCLVPPIMGGPLPLLQHVRDTLHADDFLAVHRKFGVVTATGSAYRAEAEATGLPSFPVSDAVVAPVHSVDARCAAVRDVDGGIFYNRAHLFVIPLRRIKTIKKMRYLYRQTSVRNGKKARSIMEYIRALGAIAVAAASPGRPGGFSGNRPSDKQHIKHREESDRELFAKNRGAFVKERQDYDRQQNVREACESIKGEQAQPIRAARAR